MKLETGYSLTPKAIRYLKRRAPQPAPAPLCDQLPVIDRLLSEFARRDRLPASARSLPALTILLDLAGNTARARPVSVTSACIASGAPPTTALRYIGELHGAGLIERRRDPRDARRTWLALTGSGEAALAGYLGALQ